MNKDELRQILSECCNDIDEVMNDKFYSGKSLNDLVKEVEIDAM